MFEREKEGGRRKRRIGTKSILSFFFILFPSPFSARRGKKHVDLAFELVMPMSRKRYRSFFHVECRMVKARQEKVVGAPLVFCVSYLLAPPELFADLAICLSFSKSILLH